jgi:cystathionine gamma-synthase
LGWTQGAQEKVSASGSVHLSCIAGRHAETSRFFSRFPYIDTLKILQKWGPGCHFLGHGLDSSIDELEAILEAELAQDPHEPPILALFTEFPSNPLLRSPDLSRLRALADKYDFLIVVDDSIGNFMNVETLPFADMVVTSLSKLFSGDSNVMGGR